MISLSDALSFSFCRRSFVLGTVLLFAMIFAFFSMGELIIYISQHTVEDISQGALIQEIITSPMWKRMGLGLIFLKTLGYSLLLSYLFIRAKQSVYDLPPRFSGEFFIRVFLTFFCISVLVNAGFYLMMPYIQKYVYYLINYLLYAIAYFSSHSAQPFQVKPLFITVMSVGFGCFLLFLFVLYILYAAYIMHFNFKNFFYKIFKVAQHPFIFIEIIIYSILFLVLTYLPIALIYWAMKTFSRDIASSFILTTTGESTPVIPLVLFAVIFGGPIALACFKTRTGRLITVLFTILFFTVYGLVWIAFRQSNIPLTISIPITVILYMYIFFYLFCFMFIMTSIIFPTCLIHLVAQGAFHVHQTFDPNVGRKVSLPKEDIPQKNTPQKDETQKDDGWL